MIGAGPAVNIALAFAILFVLALGAERSNQTVGAVFDETPAAEPACGPATRSSR